MTTPAPRKIESELKETADGRGRVWTVANAITCLRIVLLFYFLYLVKADRYGLAIIIFLIAGITDFADGFVARRFNQFSALGRFLDPAADKLLTTAAYIVMALPHKDFVPIPIWLAVAVVGRDVLILLGSLVIYMLTHYKEFKPTLLGKINTFLEIGLIFWYLVFNHFGFWIPLLPVLYGIVITSVVVTGIEYVIAGVRVLTARRKLAA
jgi:cardiolipin synthase (CMP-forming)